jgi:CelD/BcsL family acetyltransferase involved in cellulose biosynthesis
VPVLEHLRRPQEVLDALPEVERVHRERDLALSRRSDLDDPSQLSFYRQAVARHAEQGWVELTVLRIEGDMAAFDLSFRDGPSLRSWDGRIAPKWTRFRPGHLLSSALIARALDDPEVRELDWMRGEEPYKLRMATDTVPTEHFSAWSSPLVRRIAEAPRQARKAFADARAAHPGLQRAWLRVKQRVLLPDGGDRSEE